MAETLLSLRERINQLDNQILQLLNQRAQCAIDVGEIKKQESQHQDEIQYYRPERELEILKRLQQDNQGPLPDAAVARVFREIISNSMALEQILVVAFIDSSVAQQAVYRQFGQAVTCLSFPDDKAVIAAVCEDRADFGVLESHQIDIADLKRCGEISAHYGETFTVISQGEYQIESL